MEQIDERVEAIAADTDRLNGLRVDYSDTSIPVEVRIAHAEAAEQWDWARALKNQAILSRSTQPAPVQDFRRGGDTLTLKEQIVEANDAGDHDTARRLMNQLVQLSANPPMDADAEERLRERSAAIAQAQAEYAAEQEADLERTNAARRSQLDAIQRLPKEARDLAMHQVFGGPRPGAA